MLNNMKLFLDIIGYVSSILVIISFFGGLFLWIQGIIPVLLRLGNGLTKNKLALFDSNSKILHDIIDDSKLFIKENIISIPDVSRIEKARGSSLMVIYWPDWKDQIDQVLGLKDKASTALIVYAPRDQGLIPEEKMKLLNEKLNVYVVNFRGRLLNDIVISLITRSYM